MNARTGIEHSAILVWALVAFGGACAADSGGASGDEGRAGSGGEAAAPAREGAAFSADTPAHGTDTEGRTDEAAPRSSDPASEPLSGSTPASANDTPSDTPPPPACIPTSDVDVPDDDFEDTNCDGIDGDLQSALFVAPDGADAAAATLSAPVRTLARAVSLANESGRAVYVCNGTYDEPLIITEPVTIYGGYDCQHGGRRIKDRAVVDSGEGIQLLVLRAAGTVHIERMAFRAPDAVTYSASSQASMIVDSTDVELVRVEFLTGDGAPGTPGVAGTPGDDAPRAGSNGGDTSSVTCSGLAATPLCSAYATGSEQTEQRCSSGGSTRGGIGGRGGNAYLLRERAVCMTPTLDIGLEGRAGQYLDGTVWRPVALADLGQRGADGADGAGATRGIGLLRDGYYSASNGGSRGKHGKDGQPGGGGRGGDSRGGGADICDYGFNPGSGGGQGGSGGCGGLAALAGGGGGGGSIGLVVMNSTVSLSLPRFEIGNGGRGGDGARGGAGQPGAAPGVGGGAFSVDYRGQPGQPGGRGGDGGDGGPGGGGPSIAVLYSGTAPKVVDAVYEIGAPGGGGTSVSLTNAAVGVTGEVVSFEEVTR